MNFYSNRYSYSSKEKMSTQQAQTITVHNNTPGQNRRGPWSPEEDRKLMELISIFGPSNWVKISNTLNTRTPKQCRERYHQNLKPSLNRTPITHEEGELIENLVAKYGKKWAEIARHLNGRSDNAIKNWWNGGANRRRRASTQVGVRHEEEEKGDKHQKHSINNKSNNEGTKARLANTQSHNDSKEKFNTPVYKHPSNHETASMQPPMYHQINPISNCQPQPSQPTHPISFKTTMFGNDSEMRSNGSQKINDQSLAQSQHPHLPYLELQNSSHGLSTHPLRSASVDTNPHVLPHFSTLLSNNQVHSSTQIQQSGQQVAQASQPRKHACPPNSSSSSSISSHQMHLPPPQHQAHFQHHSMLPTKRRLIDSETNYGGRRHSTANTVYSLPYSSGHFNNSNPNLTSSASMAMTSSSQSSAGNISPYHGSPSLLGHQVSRNNSISQVEFSTLTTSSNNSSTGSRRSSIAPDFFPNPLKDNASITTTSSSITTTNTTSSPNQLKKNASQNSFNSPSISSSSRFSFSAISNASNTNGAPSTCTGSGGWNSNKLPSVNNLTSFTNPSHTSSVHTNCSSSSMNGKIINNKNAFKPLPPIPKDAIMDDKVPRTSAEVGQLSETFENKSRSKISVSSLID